MTFPKVAIIGAGPAGLTLARLLQHNQIPCTVFEGEKSLEARDQGGTLDLHQNGGLLALKEAGLYEEFLKHARPEGEVLKIYLPDGRIIMDEGKNSDEARPAEMHGRPEIDRLVLRRMLLDSLAADSIKWGCRLRLVEPAENDTYNLHFDGKVEYGFDLVVGADGAWSKVRPLITDARPFYSGIAGLDVRISEADAREPALAARVGYGMCLTLGPNKGILSQKNGNGSIRTYAFMRVPETWEEQCGIDFTNAASACEEVIRQSYDDWSQDAKELVLKADLDTVIPRKMWMLPIGLRWANRPGVTLIGDAAHLMTPFAGVGVNVGMQDALELARNIIGQKANWQGSGFTDSIDLAAGVAQYETEMFERAEECAKQTMMYLNLFFHERGGVAMVEHFDRVKAMERAAALEKDAAQEEVAAQVTIPAQEDAAAQGKITAQEEAAAQEEATAQAVKNIVISAVKPVEPEVA